MSTPRKILAIAAFGAAAAASLAAVRAQDAASAPQAVHTRIDWKNLNLSAQQDQQIRNLEQDWNAKYSSAMPQIHHQQKHLQDLFRNPHADPIEIISTQQSISRLQEQLRSDAMSNYLRKRALLNEMQQHQLEMQLHQMVVERQQRSSAQAVPADEAPGGIMNIIQKVRWAIAPR